MHCRGCQRHSCTPPHGTACLLHVQLPAALTANRHRQKTPMHTNLWLAVIFSVMHPKAGSPNALDKLQYLRQDKPELCYSGSGRNGNTHGKPAEPWRVDSSTQPSMRVPCQQSQWPGHPYSRAPELTQVTPSLYFVYVERNDILEAESWNGNST